MVLSVENLVKQYSQNSKPVLNNVSLNFETGKIYGILGENGAGKSTLANILSGSILPSGGKIRIDGKPVVFNSPKDALKNGIAIVRQKRCISLDGYFYDNAMLAARTVSKKKLDKLRSEFDDCFGIEFNSGKPVEDYPEKERFYLSLFCELCHEPDFIVLDEPAASINENWISNFEKGLKKLMGLRKICIIIITHSLPQAVSVPDILYILRKFNSPVILKEKVTVEKLLEILSPASNENENENSCLSDSGISTDNYLETEKNGEISSPVKKRQNNFFINSVFIRLANKIFSFINNKCEQSKTGQSLSVEIKEDYKSVLEVKNLVSEYLKDISFSVLKNEIVLISGMEEDGIIDLEKILLGLKKAENGSVFINGQLIKQGRPDLLRENKAALISSEPFVFGSNENLTIRELVSGKMLFDSGFFYPPFEMDSRVKKIIEKEKFPNAVFPGQLVSVLSGGMTQRLILARELSGEISLAVLCEPDNGIDRASLKRLFGILENKIVLNSSVLILTKNPHLYKNKNYKKGSLHSGEFGWCDEDKKK